MRDITTQALEQNDQSFGSYIVDDKAAETLYGAILMQSVKDLYNFRMTSQKSLKRQIVAGAR